MEKTITLSLEEYNQLLKYKDVFEERLLKELKEFEKENEKIYEVYKKFEIEAKVLSSKIKKFESLPWYKRISYKF